MGKGKFVMSSQPVEEFYADLALALETLEAENKKLKAKNRIMKDALYRLKTYGWLCLCLARINKNVHSNDCPIWIIEEALKES